MINGFFVVQQERRWQCDEALGWLSRAKIKVVPMVLAALMPMGGRASDIASSFISFRMTTGELQLDEKTSMDIPAVPKMLPWEQDIALARESGRTFRSLRQTCADTTRSTFTTIRELNAPCACRLRRCAYIRHNFGYGVGDEMDHLLSEHRVDG